MEPDTLTKARYELLTNQLSPDGVNTLNTLLTKAIGYSAPMELMGELNQYDELESEEVDTLKPPKADFTEAWYKGARYSRLPLDMKGIIFHHTGASLSSAINWLTKHNTAASYHAIIDSKQKVVHRLVDDNYRAWHAGYGDINGRNPNHVTLSISFVGDTNTGEARESKLLTKNELDVTVAFIQERFDRLDFNWIKSHKQVDSKRRNDVSDDVMNQLTARLKKDYGKE